MRVDAKTSTIRVRGAGIDAWIFHSLFSPSVSHFLFILLNCSLYPTVRISPTTRFSRRRARRPLGARRSRARRAAPHTPARPRRARRRPATTTDARSTARPRLARPNARGERSIRSLKSAIAIRHDVGVDRATSTDVHERVEARRRRESAPGDARERRANARERADGDANDRGRDGGTRDARRADKRETTRRDDGDARGRGVELGLDERDRGCGNDRGSDVVVVGRR